MKTPIRTTDQDKPHRRGDETSISGDPGVGGLLSDPMSPPRPHEEPDLTSGPASSDPEPPRHHGDWMPPKKDAQRGGATARVASLLRRKSRGGMPRTLFHEGDGITLNDLQALARHFHP